MDFMKFWHLVENYPWLPRILPCLVNEITKPLTGIEEIVGFLGPKAVKEKIKYIAFRPWNNLNRSEKSVYLSSRLDENGQFESYVTGVFFRLLWHREGEPPFSSEMNNDGDENLTVGHLLANVYEELGHVDLVVRVIYNDSEKGRKSRNSDTPADRLAELVCCDSKYIESYDLFLPE